MAKRLRLRDYLAGHTEPPRLDVFDLEELLRDATAMDDTDPEEMARLCRRGQARVWERIEEIMREEGRLGE